MAPTRVKVRRSVGCARERNADCYATLDCAQSEAPQQPRRRDAVAKNDQDAALAGQVFRGHGRGGYGQSAEQVPGVVMGGVRQANWRSAAGSNPKVAIEDITD